MCAYARNAALPTLSVSVLRSVYVRVRAVWIEPTAPWVIVPVRMQETVSNAQKKTLNWFKFVINV